MHKQKQMLVYIVILFILLSGGVGYVWGRGPFVVTKQVQRILQSQSLFKAQAAAMDQAAARAVVQSVGDVYTQLLTKQQMNEMLSDLSAAATASLGIEVVELEKSWLIANVAKDSPAAKANLKKGDLITAINGETPNTAYQPQEGVAVLLTIARDGLSSDCVVIPEVIEPFPAVESKVFPGGYGYIRIRSFLPEDVEQLFKEALEAQKDDKGLVIDLRHNAGGRMDAALTMLDLFLPKGRDILCIWNAKGLEQTFKTKDDKTYAMPVYLLVDEQSASAAEIFAAVLQNQQRATLLGCTTFGKGMVQKMKVLKDGSGLKYTVSEYKLPDGTAINEKGVRPDVVMPAQKVPGWAGPELEDAMLQKALEQLKLPK